MCTEDNCDGEINYNFVAIALRRLTLIENYFNINKLTLVVMTAVI